MPLDAICLSALTAELRKEIVGARIDKIFQPGRDLVVLNLHAAAGARKLLISAVSGSGRISLINGQTENPAQPPMFCMLMRKYISGGRITNIIQPNMDRIVELDIACKDEMGFPTNNKLIVELMGKWSNIVLLNGEERIIDCIHKSSGAVSSMRSLLPGLFYHFPDPQDKHNIFEVSDDSLNRLLDDGVKDVLCEKWLMNNFAGISPLISRECADFSRTTGRYISEISVKEKTEMAAFVKNLRNRVNSNDFVPYMLLENGMPKDFTFMPIHQYGNTYEGKAFENFSALFEEYFRERDRTEHVRRIGHDIIKTMQNTRDRLRRKIQNQKKELAESMDRDYYRICGDIITSNIYNLEKGMNKFEAINYYDPECKPISIKLDPLLTPQQNAAKYYRDYNKAKTAQVMLTEQINIGERELEYTESVIDELSRADGEQTIAEIRRELEENGYLKKQPNKKTIKNQRIASPLEFRTSAGFRVLVGKNNLQNDNITLKTASKWDVWFHTQKIHGSHVVLFTEGNEPDDMSVSECAMLAAYYSQGKDSSNVPVDYTRVKNVKKPHGSRPGMVVYETYNTLFVTPDAKRVEELKKHS